MRMREGKKGARTALPFFMVETVIMCHAPSTGVRIESRSRLLLISPSARAHASRRLLH